jgi:hypothetical protein
MGNPNNPPPEGFLEKLWWCVQNINILKGRVNGISTSTNTSGSTSTPTLQQVLTEGNQTTDNMYFGPSTGSTPYRSVQIGQNLAQGDGSGDIRVWSVPNSQGVYYYAVHTYASDALSQAAIHMAAGPSNGFNPYFSALMQVTQTSVIISLQDTASNSLNITQTGMQIIDVTNSAGNSVTVTNSILGSNQIQYLPNATGIISVANAGNRLTGQITAVSGVLSGSVAAVDASYVLSANVNITTATLFSFGVTINYTDETNTARVQNLSFSNLAGTISTTLTNAGGAVPYNGIPVHIRCKAGTNLTVQTTSGTYTTVVYNIEATCTQIR